MISKILVLFLMTISFSFSFAQQAPTETIQIEKKLTKLEKEITTLSKNKWQWMADKNVEELGKLFDEKSMFVHMGGTWGREQEINVIKSGGIWYKKAEVYSVIVNAFGNTAIVFNDIDLVAVVGGNEVVNPFMVTEVYIKQKGKWKMGSLTFSHLRREVKMKISENNTPK